MGSPVFAERVYRNSEVRLMLHRLRPRYPQASVVGLTLGLILWAQPLTPQNASLEYKVKAAFLFNFAKFVEWPSGAFSRPDAPFTICLAGDPFAGELERTIDGNTLNGRPLAVFRIGEGEPVRDCHMIYISVPESRRSGDFIKAAANLPILTVGEHE